MSALIESQKGSQRSATAARKEQKKTYKSIGKPAAIAAGVLVLLFSFSSWLHEWRAKREAAPSKPTASTVVQAPQVQVVAQVLRQRITLTTNWSKGIRVMGDQCIQWWGENPTGYDVQASGGPIPLWKDWAEWKIVRAAGKLGDPWQFRFKAKEGTLDLEYEIRSRDQCIKK
jgi:hypothetical protein